MDQHVKGKANRLKPKEVALVDEMRAAGEIRKAFNTGFFHQRRLQAAGNGGHPLRGRGHPYLLAITFRLQFSPAGVMAAIYLEEFAPDNRLMHIVEVNINNLAAILSILFGLLPDFRSAISSNLSRHSSKIPALNDGELADRQSLHCIHFTPDARRTSRRWAFRLCPAA